MATRIGVTLGDPAGIGPEIVAKSLPGLAGSSDRVLLIGNWENFSYVLEETGIPKSVSDRFRFIDIPSREFEIGKVSAEAGSVALRSIETAVRMALGREVGGICTAPISKEAIISAGSKYRDHTEMLGSLTGTRDVSTVFETRKLRITFMSKHRSLSEALDLITEDEVVRQIKLADYSLRLLGIRNGRIAVAAINPHAGENGLFGREEIDVLTPAIFRGRSETNVSGPYPADSVFHRAAQGEFDMVLSMFHDQGHIAAKMYDFHRTVSMNIGLPFLRTSVDHGTAFDIAGEWVASEASMSEAIKKALKYSESYRSHFNSTPALT